MSIGPIKTAGVGSAPWNGVGPSTPRPKFGGDSSVDEALKATSDYIAGVTPGPTAPSPDDDPFLALRYAIEANGGTGIPNTGDFAPVYVLTSEELVAQDPTLNGFADGQVDSIYARLRTQFEMRLQKLQQQMTSAAATPAQIHVMQQVAKQLEAALLQIDAERATAETLKQQVEATYAEELALFTQDGFKDLNNDGVIGDYTTSPYLVGYRMIANVREEAIVHRDTRRLITFDPITKKPVEGDTPMPSYAWTVAKPGLELVDPSITTETDANSDITLRLGDNLSAATASGNDFMAPLNLQVPEYLWVRRDAKHLERPLEKENGHYEIKPFEGMTQSPPSEGDLAEWMQVKVTDVRVRSEKPIDWPKNGTQWTQADGFDHIVELRGKDGGSVQIRIKGRVTNGSGADAAYVHHDFVAASSVGIAFTGGDDDMRRRSAVNFIVEDSFVSTTNHQYPQLGDTYDVDANDPNNTNPDRRTKAIHDTLDRFTSLTHGYSVGADRTGVFITGLTGNIVGSQWNDVIIAPDQVVETQAGAPEDRTTISTTIDAGDGYNFVQAGKGDHYVRNATYFDKRGAAGDKTVVEHRGGGYMDGVVVPGGIQQVVWDEETGKVETRLTSKDPKVYIHVDTPGGETHIHNPAEVGVKGTVADEGRRDDVYEVTSGIVGFTNPADYDIDTSSTHTSETLSNTSVAGANGQYTDAYSMFQSFGDMQKKIASYILDEAPVDEEGIIGSGWEVDAEYSNEQKQKLDGFFREWARMQGMEVDADVVDEEEATADEVAQTFGS